MWLGLTDLYNLFHDRGLTPELAAKRIMTTSPPVLEAQVLRKEDGGDE